MSTSKSGSTESTGRLDEDFNFDGEEEFFPNKEKDKPLDIKDIKNKEIQEEDDEEDETTKLDEKGKDVVKKKEGKKKEEEEEEEEEFFDDFEDKKDDVVDKKEGGKEDKEDKKDKKDGKDGLDGKNKEEGEEVEERDKKFFSVLAAELKEKGVLANVELPKDKDITEDEFFELQEQEIEARIDETFKGFFEDMSQEGKDFLKYMKDGGKASDFLAQYGATFDITNFNEDNKGHQDKTIDYYLRVYEQLDDEEFDDKKKMIEDNGKNKAYAAKYYKIIQADEAKRKTDLLEFQSKAAQKLLDNTREFNEKFKAHIEKSDSIGIFKISKNEQRELNNYIIRPTIKVKNNNYIPEFQSELNRILRAKTKEDKDDLIQLAKLVRDKFKIPDIKKEAKTEVVSKIKSKLEQAKQGIKSTTAGTYSRRSLADFIDQ